MIGKAFKAALVQVAPPGSSSAKMATTLSTPKPQPFFQDGGPGQDRYQADDDDILTEVGDLLV